ncbi:FtsX-like permease family protein [Streptomyces sp. NPDC001070]
MRGLRADALLAWSLLRGSPRGERWRLALTGLGATLGTGFGLAALTVAVIGTRFGGGPTQYTNDLLNSAGLRSGVIGGLLLLILPVLAFVGQCTRIGALRRERRLAALRLAGATPRQVRQISALETGAVCGLGSLAGLTGFLVLRAVLGAAQQTSGQRGTPMRVLTWPTEVRVPWFAALLVVAAVPVLATLEARFTLRRSGEDALGVVSKGRRPRPRVGLGRLALWALAPLALVAATGLQLLNIFVLGPSNRGSTILGAYSLVSAVVVVLCAIGLLYGTAGLAMVTGRLAARSGRPELLIAGERLQADPWAAARSHAAVMLTVLIGVGFIGVRRLMIEDLTAPRPYPYTAEDLGFYFGGLNLTGLGILIGLAVTISGLAVGAIESVITRRRTLAALAATGVPRSVLSRAALLETALPLVPATALAGACGLMITGTWWAGVGLPESLSLPLLEPLLTAAGLLAAALLATAASLPLLRRTVQPAQLRHE